MIVKEALSAWALSQERTFEYDRLQTVGASEIGRCARQTWFRKHKQTPDADYEEGWGYRSRGSNFEASWWVPAMRSAYGERLLFSGDQQRTFVSDFLSATIDGLLMPEEIVLDCKSLDPRAANRLKPEHETQVIAGIGILRETTNYRPEKGIVSYTNASDFSETHEFEVAWDPEGYDHLKRRARTIMTAPKAADLLPEGVIKGSQECRTCPYVRSCGQVRYAAVPVNSGDPGDEAAVAICALAYEAHVLEDAAAKAEAIARDVKQKIKERLQEAGTRSVKRDGISVSWSAVKPRTLYDNEGVRAAAQAAGVDLSTFQKSTEASDRLVISVKDEANG